MINSKGILHFDEIANIYDDAWSFSKDYNLKIINKIQRCLKLNSSDTLLDVGGGTGKVTSALKINNKLKRAICIEPSKKMCAYASKINTIETICIDSNSFFENPKIFFNKVLMKEMIHHVLNRKKLFSSVYKSITPKGIVLIVTRPQELEFPVFEDAKNVFKKNQPAYSDIVSELIDSGFDCELQKLQIFTTLPLDKWLKMIENRFMSDLAVFSKKELKEGINQIQTQHQKNRNIEIKDTLVFILASKD